MEPKLVTLARVASGLTQGQLAERLGVSQPFISQVEQGVREIPPSMLPQWCRECDIPESFLRSGRRPLDDSMAAMVHRKMATLPAKPLNRANAQVKMRTLEIDALFAEVDIIPSLPVPRVPRKTGSVDAAAHVRRIWRIPGGPLPSLVGLVESAGLPIVLTDSFHHKQSATSHQGRWCDWVIVLNSTHPPSRKRYTLAHELAHVVMRHNETIPTDTNDYRMIENQANQFAAELLMPTCDARRELNNVNFKRFVFLKQRWRVSIAFLIRRALDVGTITPDQRKRYEIELSTLPGGRSREPAEFEAGEPALIRRTINALVQVGLSKAEIADLVGMTERRLRVIYLNEPDRPRLLTSHPPGGSNRVVVELPFLQELEDSREDNTATRKGAGKGHRSAITGRYVKRPTAERHPRPPTTNR